MLTRSTHEMVARDQYRTDYTQACDDTIISVGAMVLLRQCLSIGVRDLPIDKLVESDIVELGKKHTTRRRTKVAH
jgi:hypothetical protein